MDFEGEVAHMDGVAEDLLMSLGLALLNCNGPTIELGLVNSFNDLEDYPPISQLHISEALHLVGPCMSRQSDLIDLKLLEVLQEMIS